MKSKIAERAIRSIVERGIPDPWQKFGTLLSRDGSISTQTVEAVRVARERRDTPSRNRATLLFEEKLGNLKKARLLLHHTMEQYDAEGMWKELDETLQAVDMSEALEILSKDFALHPFPVVLKSLEFNWGYMKQYGTRAFYEMTDQYLAKIQTITEEAYKLFTQENLTGEVRPYWLIRMDLVSIETPTHCDVCRLTIALILSAREVTERNFSVSGEARV